MSWFYKSLSGVLATLLFATTWPWVLRGQDAVHTIGGRVFDSEREAVSGMKVIATDASGKIALEATSNSDGVYCLEQLPTGRYHLKLEPLGSNFQGNTVVAFLGSQDLTVDWFVAANVKAVGAASLAQPTCSVMTQTQKRVVGGIFGVGWLGSLIIPFVTSPSR